MSDDDNLPDIIDPQDFGYTKEDSFSHPALAQKAYYNCIAAGSVEMIKGFWETKMDRQGNQMRSYHPDTRQVYISCVETLKNILISDLDDDARKKIMGMYKYIKTIHTQLIAEEEKWFNKLNFAEKNKIQHIYGFLNQEGIYYHQLVNVKVEVYRRIFEELELLLKRTKYLKKKVFVNVPLDDDILVDDEMIKASGKTEEEILEEYKRNG